jgi:hypothetical protein
MTLNPLNPKPYLGYNPNNNNNNNKKEKETHHDEKLREYANLMRLKTAVNFPFSWQCNGCGVQFKYDLIRANHTFGPALRRAEREAIAELVESQRRWCDDLTNKVYKQVILTKWNDHISGVHDPRNKHTITQMFNYYMVHTYPNMFDCETTTSSFTGFCRVCDTNSQWVLVPVEESKFVSKHTGYVVDVPPELGDELIRNVNQAFKEMYVKIVTDVFDNVCARMAEFEQLSVTQLTITNKDEINKNVKVDLIPSKQ